MTPRPTILLVEDDAPIRQGVADALSFNGYHVLQAADGREGLRLGLSAEIDLALLDIMMPGLDGLQLLKELRKSRPALPVIFLTAKGEEADRVKGLRVGADDYVVKPFGVGELIARVEAVLRRSPERPRPTARLELAGRTVDFNRREATLPSGEVRPLAEREAEVLAYLAANAGRAVSREELLQRVWGFDPRGTQTRTVDMAVARLREALDDSPSAPRVIATVRGRGYMLAAPTPPAGTPT